MSAVLQWFGSCSNCLRHLEDSSLFRNSIIPDILLSAKCQATTQARNRSLVELLLNPSSHLFLSMDQDSSPQHSISPKLLPGII